MTGRLRESTKKNKKNIKKYKKVVDKKQKVCYNNCNNKKGEYEK